MIFGSELKALRADPSFESKLDRDALALFLRLAYVPAPTTIYDGVKKLTPGTILIAREGAEPELKPFWSLEDVVRDGLAQRFDGSEDEAINALDTLLGEAVRCRMIADVPLGAFLSGGIDSSTVVALMQASNPQKVKTFTIGFRETGYDEAPDAHAVATHLGTDHTALYVSPEHARAVIPRLPEIYDEPFADPSQIPTYLISELTRRHVTVALSGDGGDEMFGGYNRYLQLRRLLAALESLPPGAGGALAAGLRAVPLGAWSALGGPLLGDRAQKLALMIEGGGAQFYRRLVSHWWNAETLVAGATAPQFLADDAQAGAFIADRAERMQFLDTMTYLPDRKSTRLNSSHD